MIVGSAGFIHMVEGGWAPRCKRPCARAGSELFNFKLSIIVTVAVEMKGLLGLARNSSWHKRQLEDPAGARQRTRRTPALHTTAASAVTETVSCTGGSCIADTTGTAFTAKTHMHGSFHSQHLFHLVDLRLHRLYTG